MLINLTINLTHQIEVDGDVCNTVLSYFEKETLDEYEFEVLTNFVLVSNNLKLIDAYVNRPSDMNLNEFLNNLLHNYKILSQNVCINTFEGISAKEGFFDEMKLEDIDIYLDSCIMYKNISDKSDASEILAKLTEIITSRLEDENDYLYVLNFLTSLFYFDNELIPLYVDFIGNNIINNINIEEYDEETISALFDFFTVVFPFDSEDIENDGLFKLIFDFLSVDTTINSLFENGKIKKISVLRSYTNLFKNIISSNLQPNESVYEFFNNMLLKLYKLSDNEELVPLIFETFLIAARFRSECLGSIIESMPRICEYVMANCEYFSTRMIYLAFNFLDGAGQ